MQKYCPKCDKIFSSVANFCSWCGEDMRKYIEYPDVKTWEEQKKLHQQMKRDAQLETNYKDKPIINKQLGLFD